MKNMEISLGISFLIVSHLVIAQGANLFVSIDCGASGTYNDPLGYTWLGDTQFVQTGLTAKVRTTNPGSQPLTTLRYFPTGVKNCYTISGVAPGSKTMVRAAFYYGNYDGLSFPPTFDLVLDSNLWATITSSLDQSVIQELIYITGEDSVSVCVARSQKNNVPFISSLEIRVVDQLSYKDMESKYPLMLLSRHAFGSAQIIRYPDDIYDRVWLPYSGSPGVISVTSKQTNISDTTISHPPIDALLHAITPESVNATTLDIPLPYNMANDTQNYYFTLYFSEVTPNASRGFSIMSDGVVSYEGPEIPPWGSVDELYGNKFVMSHNSTITLVRKPSYILPPLVNAAEFFILSNEFTNSRSDPANVKALRALQSSYPQLQAWSGDPCLPTGYNWEWLNCNSETPSQVTALYLSGYGLSGPLVDFSALTYLEIIDLHNNSLSGSIPEFLGRFSYLKELNLADNHFNGSLPASLANNPSIKLNISGNDLQNNPIPGKHHINLFLIIGSVVGGTVVLCLVAFLIFCIARKNKAPHASIEVGVNPRPTRRRSAGEEQLQEVKIGKRFTYAEILAITNKFTKQIGGGGSGDVFYGQLNNGQEVAVKVIKSSHPRGPKDFETEVKLLLTARHKFLVLCLGYCDEDENLILIYEYMPKGNLRELLSGKPGVPALFLTWEKRLEVALSVATGLDYLHTGCRPPIIHRDVKATNILLDENLEAKLADFGLCKVGPNKEVTLLSTVVAGTAGYIDPEYYTTFNLSEKSDVYSFGVVLLELMTGQLPILTLRKESVSIIKWTRENIAKGDTHSVLDSKLGGVYNVDSVWKVAYLAFACTSGDPNERPAMNAVISQLKEAIGIETGTQSSGVVTTEITQSSSQVDSVSVVVSMPTAR